MTPLVIQMTPEEVAAQASMKPHRQKNPVKKSPMRRLKEQHA
jgi:hypothetical protein